MSLNAAARRLAKLLKNSGHKIVFAESCTGGLVSASLAALPGISAHLCGSMVTYRNETKAAYLGIAAEILQSPGPVSEAVAQLMVDAVFECTPEATIAISITGHLGPDAPVGLDGVVFIGVHICGEARRGSPYWTAYVIRLELSPATRRVRQRLAAEAVLSLAADHIEQPPESHWQAAKTK